MTPKKKILTREEVMSVVLKIDPQFKKAIMIGLGDVKESLDIILKKMEHYYYVLKGAYQLTDDDIERFNELVFSEVNDAEESVRTRIEMFKEFVENAVDKLETQSCNTGGNCD